ncbi:hypothetical protein EU508_00700 [Pseudoalteromonas fuliginea]|uniref:Uncharacterized protein n=1 Tax=Pseudoalteromonas fuliginea TaxID=1872678 RepID=A0AB73BM10_9GAMM|nr:hypothetical protein [Pseudoalteromonas fuliginea]KAA1165485.1 hypothetical protein EU508_00700 [Pseudoalteromonas fuliginea]
MLRTDLKILKPQRIGNEPHAGGHRTSNAIVSGKLNDVFSSISDIDHARSSFDLVKLYPALSTDDASRLQDAHIFLSDQPDDPLVNILLVEAKDLKDTDTVAEMLPYFGLASTKFHGTSLMTGAVDAQGQALSVESITRTLTPSITTVSSKIGLKPDSVPFSIYRTKRILSYGEITEINLSVDDFLESEPTFYGEYQYIWYYDTSSIGQPGRVMKGVKTLKINTGSGELNSLLYQNGTFSCAKLTPSVAKDQYFTLYYVSNQDFRFHSFTTSLAITLGAGETVLKGSVKLKKTGGETVYKDDSQGRFISGGYVFATIDYDTGVITEIDSVNYNGTVTENLGALIQKGALTINAKQWQLPSSSFARDSVYITFETAAGATFSASSDLSGNITGTNCTGTVSATGYVDLAFSEDVKPDSIRFDYNEIEVTTVPAPPGGFDTSTLPNNGTVPIFYTFNPVSVQNRKRTAAATLSSGQTITVLADADFIDIVDSLGASLWSVTDDNYSYDAVTGDITINAGISAFSPPFIITAIQSELALIDAIDNNTLILLTPLKRAYPAGATVSSVQVLGDFQAQTKDERTLAAWQNNFGDTGAAASSAINTTQYPLELTNIGAIAQRWAIVFTSTTAYNVIGESVGNIYSGDTLNDCAPINSFAGAPYFILRKEAFGAGLNPGEAFLFETLAASKPIMVTRSVSPGHSEIVRDNSTLSFRGNKD